MKVIVLLWLVSAVGWITNIVNVITYAMDATKLADISVYHGLEIVGIFIAPIGVVLGFASWF